jgi:hypothetical protein
MALRPLKVGRFTGSPQGTATLPENRAHAWVDEPSPLGTPFRRALAVTISDLMLDTEYALLLVQRDEGASRLRWAAAHLQNIMSELVILSDRLCD